MKKTVLLLLAALNLTACSAVNTQDPRTTSIEWRDSQLSAAIAGIVNKTPYRGNARLNAVSYDGNVVLMGQARTLDIKDSLLEKIRSLEGIQKVYDQIHIKPPVAFSQVSRDTWLTTKIKTALLTSKQLINSDIKVITEDGEVFLFGYVTPEQGESATEIARNVEGVKRVIQGWFTS